MLLPWINEVLIFIEISMIHQGVKEYRWSINEDQFDLNAGKSNDNILSFHTVLSLPPLSLEHYITVVCKGILAPTDEFLKKKMFPNSR